MWRRRKWPEAFFGISEATWLRQRAADDMPPPHFSKLRHFSWEWHEGSPREEADYVRWVFMDAGASYDEAEAEVRACTTLLDSEPVRVGFPIHPRLKALELDVPRPSLGALVAMQLASA